MEIEIKQITHKMIEDSPEILQWLTQFSGPERSSAISLLTHLKFVSRDSYSAWLRHIVQSLLKNEKSAFYAVRKLKNKEYVWEENGDVIKRPPDALGSEELIISSINDISKPNYNYFDHPSIPKLKTEKIHNIVLIDDAIGSGKRVSDYINKMMHPTLKSWWSYGIIKLYIVSFARTISSEKVILNSTPGSNHYKRKHKKSEKIHFESNIRYSKELLENRWGMEFQKILYLCDSKTKILPDYRRGYGEVMGNIIFYHSVPNNTPGMLYCSVNNWQPLFPGRILPGWTINLLNMKPKTQKKIIIKPIIQTIFNYIKSKSVNYPLINEEMLQLLLLIKRGVRNKTSLSLRMDRDIKLINKLLNEIISSGLITQKHFLTERGKKLLHDQNINEDFNYNYSLYIPRSWCTDQSSIQPFAVKKQTDSVSP